MGYRRPGVRSLSARCLLAAVVAACSSGPTSSYGIALDATGRLYVANSATNSITVYAAAATGNVTPMATIAGSNTGLHLPTGITVDAAGSAIYVGNFSSITVYPGVEHRDRAPIDSKATRESQSA